MGGVVSNSRQCDFSPFWELEGIRLHRRKKTVFYADPHLFKFAREASDIMSAQIGRELFEIRRLNSDYVASGNGINEMYIQTKADLFEDKKKLIDQGLDKPYAAYCDITGKFNHSTGEIYESDIVFSPEYYIDPMKDIKEIDELSQSADQRLREEEEEMEEFFEQEEEKIRHIKNKDRRNYFEKRLRAERRRFERYVESVEKDLEDFDENTDKYEDSLEDRMVLTMMHEMGHALGFDHRPEDPENLMYPTNVSTKGLLNGKQIRAALCAFRL